MKLFSIFYISLFCYLLLSSPLNALQDEAFWLKYLLSQDAHSKAPKYPVAKIYMKNNILYCTGTSKLAALNNKAATFIEQRYFLKAIEVLKQGLKQQSLFFPYRYNLGFSYMHANNFQMALFHFDKAILIVPQYSKTYLQVGYIYERKYKEDIAIEYYRKAIKQNSKELNGFILIGDIYFNREQFRMAKRYYRKALSLDYRFPNALLGLAKIHFINKKYIQARVVLRTIDTSKDYDKSLHYYFAECSYKLKDYKTASEQYTKLLQFKTDKFFITKNPSEIVKKLELSNKLKDFQLP